MIITDDERMTMAWRCGLDPLGPARCNELLRKAIDHGRPFAWDRGTGRTTLTLLSALVAAERGARAVVMVPTFRQAMNYQLRADELARAAGLSMRVTVMSNARALRGEVPLAVFYDHTWHEFATPAARAMALAAEQAGEP